MALLIVYPDERKYRWICGKLEEREGGRERGREDTNTVHYMLMHDHRTVLLNIFITFYQFNHSIPLELDPSMFTNCPAIEEHKRKRLVVAAQCYTVDLYTRACGECMWEKHRVKSVLGI